MNGFDVRTVVKMMTTGRGIRMELQNACTVIMTGLQEKR